VALEDADDRAGLLDTEEHGKRVTVTPTGGGPARSFDALYRAPGTQVDLGGGLMGATERPEVYALEADAAALAVGDAIVVDTIAGTFRVSEPPMPDGTGFARVALDKAWS
jgi:hypothetical protein